MLAEDKLKLKEDKARKAEQSINEMLKNNSLAGLQARSSGLAKKRDQLLASPLMEETKRSLTVYQQRLDQLKVRKTSIETHEAVKDNSYNDTVDKISSLKRTIEKDVLASIEVKIQIP